MGTEFIEKATENLKKSWDRALVALGTDDLFTRQPECAANTAVVEIVIGASLGVGERVTVEATPTGLVARKEIALVARFISPSSELVRAINSSCGIATGEVVHVHHISGLADIVVR